ncbi:MAG TPA: ABC transporter permease subunit [Candidatus Limiplasma sp.]|nr:ABC transporter permease subunit [Candidatus Limiplasma sp.]HPS80784.1 ABC transporter permease subunit [Candidatus Limiplasma sp.]
MLALHPSLPRRSASMVSSRRKKALLLCSMAAPGALWLLLLRYLPMFGIVLAFKDYRAFKPNTFWNNIIKSDWVGFSNFDFLFKSPDAWTMIRNTLLYNITFILLGLIIAVAFAIMLSELTNRFAAKTYQTLMFFPYFLSWVVASYFLFAFLDNTSGMIPNLQKLAGQEVIDWYQSPEYWPALLIGASLWKNIGYSTVLYLAAITGIDRTQYEAAAVDGATKWQQIRHVTLPNLRTMIIILFILNVGKIFNADFGLFYNVPLNSGSLYSTTQVFDTYVYRAYMNSGSVGMSSAAGLLQNVIGFVCIIAANTIVRRVDADSSLF